MASSIHGRRGSGMRSVILVLLGWDADDGRAGRARAGSRRTLSGDLRARRPADPDAGRLQCRGVSRQVARPERFRPVAAGFRPGPRLRGDREGRGRAAGLSPGAGRQPAAGQGHGAAAARRRRCAWQPGTSAYETVLRWIAAGMPRTPADAPRVERIAVEPTERTLKRGESFPMRVTAALHRRVGRGRDGAGRLRLERAGAGRRWTPRAGSRPGRSRAMRPSRRGSSACSPTAT